MLDCYLCLKHTAKQPRSEKAQKRLCLDVIWITIVHKVVTKQAFCALLILQIQ